MRRHPLPVIVVSSHSTEGASITFKALGLGAFDFVAKPQDATAHMADAARELIAKIKAAPNAKWSVPGPCWERSARPEKIGRQSPARSHAKRWPLEFPPEDRRPSNICCPQLPPDFPGNDSGGATHAGRLYRHVCPPPRRVVRLRVKEAQSGDVLQAGRVLICPGSRHMTVKRLPMGDVVVLNDEAPVNGHRPSVDVLFRSVAEGIRPERRSRC
jgi:two-component system, chemotaxis family, protein-glutamate methylesterase/glutaminase